MKALVYTNTEELIYREEPEPSAGAGEVLIRVEAAGICGGDMHAYHGHDSRRVPPLILGHEVVGVVASGPMTGKRMLIHPFITCGHCLYCRTKRSNLCENRKLVGMNLAGAFADLLVIPERNLLPVPDGLHPADAVLSEPLAAGVHAFELAARAWPCPLEDAKVLVLGAGAVGLTSALLLRHRGIEVLLGETNPKRRATAAAAGIPVFDPFATEAAAASYDIVFDAVGAGATRCAALRAVAPGGVIIHTGLQDSEGAIDMRKVTLSEIAVIGTYAYTLDNIASALAAVQSGALGDMAWVDHRPLAEGARAFADLAAGRSPAAKIVLQP
ncbi:alcohol dehydrogenase catalytic domain-containing protein [Telmatospirillum sp.]|uniref:zinc-dependent alcohol dehydrogenase n=1 Tax=Telmatospirillum sp. TaxID=2079197 RepID=UPI00283F890D|nr:alcohol dehydrogenase catalytic domain-containing protein [Telmatospirillum sp.]MDR3439822.1 alcohol dehydrogenase catalytic domain-containing protein [Telmatospirillum sp.]